MIFFIWNTFSFKVLKFFLDKVRLFFLEESSYFFLKRFFFWKTRYFFIFLFCFYINIVSVLCCGNNFLFFLLENVFFITWLVLFFFCFILVLDLKKIFNKIIISHSNIFLRILNIIFDLNRVLLRAFVFFVRLFVNLMLGHLIITLNRYVTSQVWLLRSFILVEFFISIIQCYVFFLLSCYYIFDSIT